jgi:hypothetical protein
VQLETTGKEIVAVVGNATVKARLLDGRYPRWRDTLPERDAKATTVSRADLLAATRAAAIVTSDENIPGAASRSVTVTLSATIDPGAPGNPADLNGDGVVDGVDLGVLLSGWGGDGTSDLDGNGITDGLDLGILLANWG